MRLAVHLITSVLVATSLNMAFAVGRIGTILVGAFLHVGVAVNFIRTLLVVAFLDVGVAVNVIDTTLFVACLDVGIAVKFIRTLLVVAFLDVGIAVKVISTTLFAACLDVGVAVKFIRTLLVVAFLEVVIAVDKRANLTFTCLLVDAAIPYPTTSHAACLEVVSPMRVAVDLTIAMVSGAFLNVIIAVDVTLTLGIVAFLEVVSPMRFAVDLTIAMVSGTFLNVIIAVGLTLTLRMIAFLNVVTAVGLTLTLRMIAFLTVLTAVDLIFTIAIVAFPEVVIAIDLSVTLAVKALVTFPMLFTTRKRTMLAGTARTTSKILRMVAVSAKRDATSFDADIKARNRMVRTIPVTASRRVTLRKVVCAEMLATVTVAALSKSTDMFPASEDLAAAVVALEQAIVKMSIAIGFRATSTCAFYKMGIAVNLASTTFVVASAGVLM